jgi:hypothetical protein
LSKDAALNSDSGEQELKTAETECRTTPADLTCNEHCRN